MGVRKNPETSIEAYKSLHPTELSETYKKIIIALTAHPNGLTYQEVAAVAGISEPQSHKRLPEIEAMQLIFRPGEKRKLKSGRSGFVWKRVVQPNHDNPSTQIDLFQK